MLALVEELVTDYITETTKAALEIGKPNKITLEDITYVIRKDKRKGTFYNYIYFFSSVYFSYPC